MYRPLLITVALLILSLVLWGPISRFIREREAIAVASSRLSAALHAERELHRVRGALPASTAAAAPVGDIAASVQAAVRDAGLAADVVLEVSPQQGAFIGSVSGRTSQAKWRRQSVTIRLGPLPLTDIGAVMDRLRAASQAWAVSQIDLRAEQPRAGDAESITFAITLQLSCTYLDTPTTYRSSEAPP